MSEHDSEHCPACPKLNCHYDKSISHVEECKPYNHIRHQSIKDTKKIETPSTQGRKVAKKQILL